MLSHFATLFGVGSWPLGPGTWASLLTLPLAGLLMWAGPFTHMGVTLVIFPIALLACQAYEDFHKTHDASAVVIDEVVGMLITLTWLPLTWQSFVFGFVIFRILDIFKPFPISWLDKKVQGGLGVMIDDVAAGLIGNLILQQIFERTSWLGVQQILISN